MDAFPSVPSPASHDPALVRVVVLQRPDRTLVLLHGEVDLTARAPLAPAAEVARSRALPVVVDASRITFLDCAGLAAVLALGSDGSPVAITAPSAPVQLLLDAAAGTLLPLAAPAAAVTDAATVA